MFRTKGLCDYFHLPRAGGGEKKNRRREISFVVLCRCAAFCRIDSIQQSAFEWVKVRKVKKHPLPPFDWLWKIYIYLFKSFLFGIIHLVQSVNIIKADLNCTDKVLNDILTFLIQFPFEANQSKTIKHRGPYIFSRRQSAEFSFFWFSKMGAGRRGRLPRCGREHRQLVSRPMNANWLIPFKFSAGGASWNRWICKCAKCILHKELQADLHFQMM